MPPLDAVPDLLRRVGRDELMSRFRHLAAGDVREKSAGDLVTTADVAAERALAEALTALLPGSVVVGEEAAHETPDLLRHVPVHECVWVVDPLDGTRHFAAGEGPFGIMVALLCRGAVRSAWIHLPLEGCVLSGHADGYVELDGTPVTVPAPTDAIRGALHSRYFPREVAARIDAETTLERTDHRHRCAAQQYVDLVRGREHFALYHRTLPWDHAPGTFLLATAGGVARRLDGTPYAPGDDRVGLLVAASDAVWHDVVTRLIG